MARGEGWASRTLSEWRPIAGRRASQPNACRVLNATVFLASARTGEKTAMPFAVQERGDSRVCREMPHRGGLPRCGRAPRFLPISELS
jgi:hypothetical protein